ncbi:hypothetical protein [Micromonospora sp. NPDC049204]|uniref:hypothetical protein n=1 Tax=unclassified Micromonospora TaxID=2617518 RepID=UPI0033E5B293
MDEQSSVPNGPDDPAGRTDASRRDGVSVREALRRSSVGLAIGALLVLALSWIYDDDGLLAILSALGFLHHQDDRRSGRAIVTAWITAVPVALATAATLKGWLPQSWSGILFAGLGSLVGGVSYAAVTQAGHKKQQARR